jgi:hypothetical protein
MLAKTWKTPEILRLSRIEAWRKARYERAMADPNIALNDPNRAKAIHAAELYTAVAVRNDGIALSSVSTYRS